MSLLWMAASDHNARGCGLILSPTLSEQSASSPNVTEKGKGVCVGGGGIHAVICH